MIKKIIKYKTIFFAIFIILLCTGLFFVNLLYTKSYAGGKYFIPQWTVSRAFIFSHENPYSDTVLYKSQLNIYGRPAMAGENEFRFTYPYFSLLLFLPFGFIGNYAIARAAWMLFLEIVVISVFLLSMSLADWKPKIRISILIFVFMISFYHTVRAIVDGNPIIVMALLMVTILLSLRNQNYPVAGILLAGTFIEIQYTFVLVIFILLFALARRKTQVISYFAGTLIILIGFSFLIQPDWLGNYILQLWATLNGLFPTNMIKFLGLVGRETGTRIGLAFGIMIVLLIIIEGMGTRNKGFGYFIWYIFLSFTFLQLSGLPAVADNYFLLLPGFIYGLKFLSERWKNKGEFIVFLITVSLSTVTWISFFISRGSGLKYQEPGALHFIFPIYVMITLYWIKWWIRRKKEFEFGQL